MIGAALLVFGVVARCGIDATRDGDVIRPPGAASGGAAVDSPTPVPAWTPSPGDHPAPAKMCGVVDFHEFAALLTPPDGLPEGWATGSDPTLASGARCTIKRTDAQRGGRTEVDAHCSAWRDSAKAVEHYTFERSLPVTDTRKLTDVAGLGEQAFLRTDRSEPGAVRLQLTARDRNLQCDVRLDSTVPLTDAEVAAASTAMTDMLKGALPRLTTR